MSECKPLMAGSALRVSQAEEREAAADAAEAHARVRQLESWLRDWEAGAYTRSRQSST